MTLELNEEQRAELARLRALDAKQKARVLELLENTQIGRASCRERV